MGSMVCMRPQLGAWHARLGGEFMWMLPAVPHSRQGHCLCTTSSAMMRGPSSSWSVRVVQVRATPKRGERPYGPQARWLRPHPATTPYTLPLLVLGLIFGTRLLSLQVFKHPELKLLADTQQIATIEASQPRRTIVDAKWNVVAIDLPTNDLYVHPSMFRISVTRMAQVLAPILEVPVPHLQARFREDSTGICLVHQLSSAKSNQIRRLGLDGLELVHHPQRIYPHRAALADVVGYVDTEGCGQAGVEASFESALAYRAPRVSCWTTGHGDLLGSRFPRPLLFQEESVLQLTVDTDLQETVSQLLQDALFRFQAKRLAAIVLEAHTGAIRCLATAPGYDPNTYQRFPVERFRCWPITDLFEPGSTFKPVNVAIALENGAIRPTQRVLDTGVLRVGDDWIKNVSGGSSPQTPEWLTPAQVLQRSSNVGMVRIMQALDPDLYHRSLVRLGIGASPPPSPLPDEALSDFMTAHSPSVVKDRHEFVAHAIEPATAAFGQGLAMTPIKLLQLIATIANGGFSVTPHVVWGVLAPPAFRASPGFPLEGEGPMPWLPSGGRPRGLWGAPTEEPPPRPPWPCWGPQLARPVSRALDDDLFGGTSLPPGGASWHGVHEPSDDAPRPRGIEAWERSERRSLPRQAAALYFGHVPVPSVELGWVDPTSIPPHARGRRRMFSPQTCRTLLRMLERVVLEYDATGSRCFLPGYQVGGKTGTAQKHSPTGGYMHDAVVTSFIGVYPISQPRFVTLVVIDEPCEPYRFASNTAADLTQAIIARLVVLLGDPPSHPTVTVSERVI